MEVPSRSKTQFIAIDGEGLNIGSAPNGGTIQHYVMMCASTGESLYKPEGIKTLDALHWLCDLSEKYPHAVFVVFGGSYDTNMILRDLTFQERLTIHKYSKIATDIEQSNSKRKLPMFGNFEIIYRPRKELYVKRLKTIVSNNGYHKVLWKKSKGGKFSKLSSGAMHLYDVYGFFQRKFVDAIVEYKLPVDDIDFIKRMKDTRNDFQAGNVEEIISYCRRECEILVKLMQLVEHYLLHPDINLKLTRWDGAGSIAGAIMKKYSVKDHLEELPFHVLEASKHAYTGGRIELIQYGHYKNIVYDYDINSAYPTFLLRLPSLKGGKWTPIEEKETEIKSSFCVCLVEWDLWDIENRIYPFPYRQKDGTIIYPSRGKNWVWLPEYQAAMKHRSKYRNGTINLIQVINFYPATDEKPFWFVEDMARQRLLWKQAGEGQNIMVKLGLNSLYGKTAQQIGGYYDEKKDTLVTPPYHNLAYAGFVTSSTRASLFDSAMQKPTDVIMFATDGLFTISPFTLPISKLLGEWECTKVLNFTAVQSGVYYYDVKKDFKDFEEMQIDHFNEITSGLYFYLSLDTSIPKIKSRGFDPSSISRESVISTWKEGKKSKVIGRSRKFITFGMLATGQKPDTIKRNMRRLCNWETVDRELCLYPLNTKRHNTLNDEYETRRKPSNGLMKTYPKVNADYEEKGTMSHAYRYIYTVPFDKLTESEQQYLRELEEVNEEDML